MQIQVPPSAGEVVLTNQRRHVMGQLRQRMTEDLKLAGYSPVTRRIYLHYTKSFVRHFMRPPAEMGEAEIRSFLLNLLEVRKLSHDSYRQCYAALKFLYTVTLRRPFEVESIPRRRGIRPLPEVLSGTEVEALFEATESLKYRTILMALYGAGLRISEACRLGVSDIDSRRMLIHVRLGKGGRDRFAMLSEKLLDALRAYWRAERPPDLLFPGQTRDGHLSPTSVRHVLNKAKAKVGLRKRVTPHLLRHSFATHLLETGVDIAVIQALLGHRYLRSTTRYTSVSTSCIRRLKSPLDLLGTPEGAILG